MDNSQKFVSYVFVEEFLNNHKIEVYSHSLFEEFPNSNTILTVYLPNTYIYLHIHDEKLFLVVEVFREEYRIYVFGWPGNRRDFRTTINNLNIFFINENAYYVNPYDINVLEERKILDVVLKAIIVDRKFIATKYGFK